MNSFLIISLRRCGSTFLACELDSYEGIFCQKEFVLRDPGYLKKPHALIQGDHFSFVDAIREFSFGAAIAGSKLTIPEYAVDKVDSMLEIVRKDKIKVIHLTRDFHELMISMMAVKRTGIWHKSENMSQASCPEWLQGEISSQHDALPEPFSVTVEEIEGFFQKADWIDRRIAELHQTNPYLHIRHDEIASRLEEILQFILPNALWEVPIRSQHTQLERVISVPHEHLVVNWEAVASLFDQLEQTRAYRRSSQ